MKLPTSMWSAAIRVLAASEPLDARDVDHVRADALDLGAERDEEAAEVLNVRLARRVRDRRPAGRERRGHDRVLGRHDRRLVEVDARAAQLALEVVAAVHANLGAELGQRVDVRVEPAAADHVAAGRRHLGAAEARQQRAGEQERRADAARELLVHLVGGEVGGLDAHLVRAEPVDVGAELVEQRQHRLHVEDARDVVQNDGLFRQQARGEDRQGAVLVALGPDVPGEPVASLDDE